MSTTQASKATRAAKRHFFIAMTYTQHKPLAEVIRLVIERHGSLNGIPSSWIERAKQEQAYKPYQDAIFEGAVEAGAPVKTVKGHFATVGYKQGVKGGLVPVSQIGNLWPHQGQAHTRSDRRDRDARALVRAQKRAIRESEKSLATWSTAS